MAEEIMWLNNLRYLKKAKGHLVKLCMYYRQSPDGRQKSYCRQTAKSRQTLCKYHLRKGKLLDPSIYFSQHLGTHVSSNIVPPREGDMRYDFDKVFCFDANKWRRCCRVCWRQGRQEYCQRHNPRHVHVQPVSSSSRLACEFLDQLEIELGEKVMHRHIDPELKQPLEGREYEIPDTKYKVDGYVARTKTVYEFLGDYWHGNPDKYDPEDTNKNMRKTYGQLYEETFQRMNDIVARGYKVYYVWEKSYAEYKKRLKEGVSEESVSVLDLMTEVIPLDASSYSLLTSAATPLQGVSQGSRPVTKIVDVVDLGYPDSRETGEELHAENTTKPLQEDLQAWFAAKASETVSPDRPSMKKKLVVRRKAQRQAWDAEAKEAEAKEASSESQVRKVSTLHNGIFKLRKVEKPVKNLVWTEETEKTMQSLTNLFGQRLNSSSSLSSSPSALAANRNVLTEPSS